MKRNKLLKFIIVFTGIITGNQFLANSSPGPRKIYFQHVKTQKIDSVEVDFYGNTRFTGIQNGQYRISFIGKDHLIQNQKFSSLLVYSLNSKEIYHFDNMFFTPNLVVNGNINCDKVGIVCAKESRPKTLEKRPHRLTPKIVPGDLTKSRTEDVAETISTDEVTLMKDATTTHAWESDAPTSPEKSKKTSISEFGSSIHLEESVKVERVKRLDYKEMPVRKPAIESEEETYRAGIVTAGRWSDLENWSKFQKTHEEASIKHIQNVWGFDLLHKRISVKITNEKGIGLPQQRLELRNEKDSAIWSTITDNQGLAELWAYPFSLNSPNKLEKMNLYLLSDFRWTSLGKVSVGNNSIEEFRLNKSIENLNEVDVCFVMDATGSMGDEIRYLQKELSYFVQNAQISLPCSKIRISSVFYRDNGDAYVSKSAEFTERIDDILGFISEQSAGGGGDFPEAVDAGLNTAINELKWSSKSIAKIIFLVLDAPPHEYKAKKIRELVQEASSKGIKIIPITASGINTSTEFLMKYMASMTGGEYVYITEHSGVGNSHIKPTGVKENVDLLKNQWMNILIKYAQYGNCDKLSDSLINPIQVDPRRNIFGNQQVFIETYPNPASNYIDVESNTDIVGIKWYDMNHRLIMEIKNDQPSTKKRFEFPVQVPGFYILEVNTVSGNFNNKTMLTHGFKS